MYIRFLFIVSILMPQLGWSKNASIESMTSDEFFAFATCAPRADVIEQVVFKDARDLQGFTHRRQNLRDYIVNSEKEIQEALANNDTFTAGMICAWVDDMTLGFSIACPSDEDPEKDLVSEFTFTTCQRLARK